jgi:hypothetical protein
MGVEGGDDVTTSGFPRETEEKILLRQSRAILIMLRT